MKKLKKNMKLEPLEESHFENKKPKGPAIKTFDEQDAIIDESLRPYDIISEEKHITALEIKLTKIKESVHSDLKEVF